ncbi:hypothetical protein GCM10017691_41970 [Pseudonocardia petroleophila]
MAVGFAPARVVDGGAVLVSALPRPSPAAPARGSRAAPSGDDHRRVEAAVTWSGTRVVTVRVMWRVGVSEEALRCVDPARIP